MPESNRVVAIDATRTVRCAECARSRVCFGRYLHVTPAGELEGLTVSSRLLHRGDHVFFSGQPCHALAIVKSGQVKTLIVSEDGDEQITGFHGAGDLLGAEGLARNMHTVDTIALDTVSVCMLNLDAALRMGRPTELPRLLMRMLSEVIVDSKELLLTLGKLDAEQRLAMFLLKQARARQRGGCSPTSFTLAMSRTDIGNHLNLAVETVSRLFTRFRQRGLIRFERNDVHWLDVNGLAQLCGEVSEAAS